MEKFLNELSASLIASFLTVTIGIPLLVLGLRIIGRYKNYKEMKVKSRIGWWIAAQPSDVFGYIKRICLKNDIDVTQICFTKSELEMAFGIIKDFQENSKQWYLSVTDFPNRTIARLPHPYYFMYYFEKFLDEYDQNYLNAYKLYTVLEKDGNFEKCSITDYGMVYNKLFYVARLFCKTNKKLNEIKDYYSDGIKESLDTRETTFYKHHF